MVFCSAAMTTLAEPRATQFETWENPGPLEQPRMLCGARAFVREPMRNLDEIFRSLVGDPLDSSALEAATRDGRLLAALEDWMASLAPTEFAACIVGATWRTAVEGHHDLIADAEMAWMNIATTQAVALVCEPEFADTDVLLSVVCDPDREVLPGITASEFFAERWQQLCDDVAEQFEMMPLPLLAQFGSTMVRSWWGTPAYLARVEAFVSAAPPEWGDKDSLRMRLLFSPLSIEPDGWGRIVIGGIGWRGE